MSSSSFFSRTSDWLRSLARNPYFWSGLGGLVVVATGVYFLFNALLMPSYTRHDAAIQVPDVMDLSFTEAKETLLRHDLAVERQVGRFNPRVPQDHVVDQNPPASSNVKPGRRVYLTVNSGTAPTVSVPDLTGTSLREARNRLMSLGLDVGEEQVDSIPSPYARTVTRQAPEPGDSLKKGASVDIWYSRGLGDERVPVPNVRGLRVDAAEARLLRQRLRSVVIDPTPADEENATAPEESETGTDQEAEVEEDPKTRLWVRQQGLDPGVRVRSGTEVRLFVTPDSTAVPAPSETSSAPSPDTTEAEAPQNEDDLSF
jgi:beta-lactam-binding protein with PASTA domain